MTLVTAGIVEIVNEIVIMLLIWTSEFQRYKNKTEEKAKSVPKILFFQFINTALLILIVNAKIPEFNVPKDFPLLNGKYVDFTVPWYRNVGTTLLIAMMMNMVTPHIAQNMLFAWPACRRCCDRKCTRDMKKTKQVLQEDYEEMYTGDEFEFEVRYAEITSAFYITMMFGAGIPSLYIVMFFQMLIMYWLDKRNFIKHMKKPPRYGVELSEMTRKLF
jgi:Calcium-activated chloride channel